MAPQPRRSVVRGRASERGAILIQVAIGMIVLIAFLAFVADYGLMWVGRRQAQNSADAGALAGAVALGFDDFADRTATGPAKQSAYNTAIRNLVAQQSPDVQIASDIYFYDDDPSKFPAECADGTCIRVDVYRNQARNNPLPVWFGQLVGVVDQGVRATAIARAAFGNATDCLKPWAVIDRWDEYWEDGAPSSIPWNFDSNFDKYTKAGNPDPAIKTPDVYTPPSVSYPDGENPDWSTFNPGSGFHPYDFSGGGATYTPDYGRQIFLKQGDGGDWNFGAGWFMRLNLTPLQSECGNQGADCYREYIKHCVGITYKIGDPLEIDNNPGSATGPTRQGVEDDVDSLVNQDPTAHWVDDPDGAGPQVGYVADSAFDSSPRIVAVPLVNPDELMATFKNGRNTVPIANIAGFFVEGVQGNGVNQVVIGRLMTMPGLMTEGNGGYAPSTFMRNITLIR